MSGWMKAMNPLSTSSNEAEARRGARASALGIGVGVLTGVWGVIYMTTLGKETIRTAMDVAAANAGSPEAAAMMGPMASIMVGIVVLTIAVQVILGLVQWFKPNIVIPILFTIFVVYGLGTSLMVPLMNPQMTAQMQAATPDVPIWQTALSWLALAIQLVLHIAGIRGAAALEKFRRASRA